MDYAYLVDCYKKELIAKVKSIKDGKYVVLDDTIFYPNSGGQPHDLGKMIRILDGKEFEVVYVGKFGDSISHELVGEGLEVSDEVKCVVEWERRYQLMKMHTAAHVISRVIYDETGANTSGNQLDIDKSRIDFNFENYDKEQVIRCFDRANELISKKIPVIKSFMKKEDALKIPDFAGPSPHLMKDIEVLRVVNIEGVDVQPCGGTHLDNIGEIGKLEFVKADNKGKSNRRLTYKIS
mgnify:CR=1 FL=1